MPLEQHVSSVGKCQGATWSRHDALASGGWCARCHTVHALPAAAAREACFALMEQLRRHRRLDWPVPVADADPRCSTEVLFGDGGGKMFGALVKDPYAGLPANGSVAGGKSGLHPATKSSAGSTVVGNSHLRH